MLFDLLDKIREKPEHVRRRIRDGLTVFFMVIIAGIWVTTLSTSLGSSHDAKVAYQDNSPVSMLAQAGSSFWGNVKSSASEFGENIDKVKSALRPEKESSGGAEAVLAGTSSGTTAAFTPEASLGTTTGNTPQRESTSTTKTVSLGDFMSRDDNSKDHGAQGTSQESDERSTAEEHPDEEEYSREDATEEVGERGKTDKTEYHISNFLN